MKLRITLSLFVLAAMVGCSKPKTADLAPLTGEEKFQFLNRDRIIGDAGKAADKAQSETPEAKAMATAFSTFQNTKEYKAAAVAQATANELAKKATDTKEGASYLMAKAAAEASGQITKEAKALNALVASSNAAQEDVFKSRGITTQTHMICMGSSQALLVAGRMTDRTAINETCKGVPDADIELRAIKTGK